MKKIKLTFKELFEVFGVDNQLYEETQKLPCDIFVETPAGELTEVLGLVKKNGTLMEYVTDQGVTFRCSNKHVVVDKNGNNVLVESTETVKGLSNTHKIISKRIVSEKADLYDIGIQSPHLYVTPNGLIHHNTYLTQECIKQAQKKGYVVFLFDSESAQDHDSLVAKGIDPEMLALIPVETVKETQTEILSVIDAIDKGQKAMIVLDSVGNLATQKEIDDAAGGVDKADMGLRAKQLKGLFRSITNRLGAKDIPMLLVNHTYECCVGGTLVSTPSGDISIEKLNIGDEVHTIFGPQKITNTFEHKLEESDRLMEIELITGEKVRCSPWHKFLVRDGDRTIWVEAQELDTNTSICLK